MYKDSTFNYDSIIENFLNLRNNENYFNSTNKYQKFHDSPPKSSTLPVELEFEKFSRPSTTIQISPITVFKKQLNQLYPNLSKESVTQLLRDSFIQSQIDATAGHYTSDCNRIKEIKSNHQYETDIDNYKNDSNDNNDDDSGDEDYDNDEGNDEDYNDDDELEILDIIGNGQLTKKILREGTKDIYPKEGDIIKINILGKLEKNDTVIIENKNYQYYIGDKSLIKGLQLAIPLMKIGEIAEINVDSKFGYGDIGKKSNNRILIPPNAKLKYIVALLECYSPSSSKLQSILEPKSSQSNDNQNEKKHKTVSFKKVKRFFKK